MRYVLQWIPPVILHLFKDILEHLINVTVFLRRWLLAYSVSMRWGWEKPVVKVSHGNLCQKILGCVLKNLCLINVHELIQWFPASDGPTEGVACRTPFKHCLFMHSRSVNVRLYGCHTPTHTRTHTLCVKSHIYTVICIGALVVELREMAVIEAAEVNGLQDFTVYRNHMV